MHTRYLGTKHNFLSRAAGKLITFDAISSLFMA
jgi:hypothetical protein